MIVEQGRSMRSDAREAVTEASSTIGTGPFELVIAFCSATQDAGELTTALAERFPGCPVVGCTTAGEYLDGEQSNGGLVLTALADTHIRWSVALVDQLSKFDRRAADHVVGELLAGVGTTLDDANPDELFCLSFIDGLSHCEEGVIAHLADALGGVALVGGSAGDDLLLRETRVFWGGRALTDAAVLVVGRGHEAFRTLKHQHFTRTDTRLVVTSVNDSGRRVLTLDGRPAFQAYARALRLQPEQVTADVRLMHPVTFCCEGELYVRSIQSVDADDSINFLCGLEEGMVLEVGGHRDMVDALEDDFARMTEGHGKFELLLGFNCILRSLESKQRGQTQALGALWRRIAAHSVGFDTYGEQLDGLHINQTLVAIGLGRRAADS